MLSFADKIEVLEAGWNVRPLVEADFYALCRKHKITVEHMPLSGGGYYYSFKGKHYIAIHNGLPSSRELFVMFHEFGHFLMHVPGNSQSVRYSGGNADEREEQEADAFAYCAVIPLTELQTHEPEELAETHGSRFLMERLEVYERYGI